MSNLARTKSGLYIPRSGLAAPVQGRARISVLDPDTGKAITQTRWKHNTMTPYFNWMVWSLIGGVFTNNNSIGSGIRFFDGTNYYPSWSDLLGNPPSDAYAEGGGYTVAAGAPLWDNSNVLGASGLVAWLMDIMYIGQYGGTAPNGQVSAIGAGEWTVFSTLVTWGLTPPGPIAAGFGFGSDATYGVGKNTWNFSGATNGSGGTITLVLAPAPSDLSMNAIAFGPVAAPALTSATEYDLGSIMTAIPTCFPQTTSTSGATLVPFNGSATYSVSLGGSELVPVSSFYQTASTVNVPSGTNLQIEYTFSAPNAPSA